VSKPRASGVEISTGLSAIPLFGFVELEDFAAEEAAETEDATELESGVAETVGLVELGAAEVCEAESESEVESGGAADVVVFVVSVELDGSATFPTTDVGGGASALTVYVAPSHVVMAPLSARVMAGPPIEVTTVKMPVGPVDGAVATSVAAPV